LGGIKDFLRIHAAGHKSGALLLTIGALTNQRSDERFTKRQRNAPSLMAIARLAKHVSSILRSTGRGASP
jgi:hypothetical protein